MCRVFVFDDSVGTLRRNWAGYAEYGVVIEELNRKTKIPSRSTLIVHRYGPEDFFEVGDTAAIKYGLVGRNLAIVEIYGGQDREPRLPLRTDCGCYYPRGASVEYPNDPDFAACLRRFVQVYESEDSKTPPPFLLIEPLTIGSECSFILDDNPQRASRTKSKKDLTHRLEYYRKCGLVIESPLADIELDWSSMTGVELKDELNAISQKIASWTKSSIPTPWIRSLRTFAHNVLKNGVCATKDAELFRMWWNEESAVIKSMDAMLDAWRQDGRLQSLCERALHLWGALVVEMEGFVVSRSEGSLAAIHDLAIELHLVINEGTT